MLAGPGQLQSAAIADGGAFCFWRSWFWRSWLWRSRISGGTPFFDLPRSRTHFFVICGEPQWRPARHIVETNVPSARDGEGFAAVQQLQRKLNQAATLVM